MTNGTPEDVAQLKEVLLNAPRLSAPAVVVTDSTASVPVAVEYTTPSLLTQVGALERRARVRIWRKLKGVLKTFAMR